MSLRKAFGAGSTCLAFGAMGLALALPLISAGQSTHGNPTDSLPPGAMQAKARGACTECHQSQIILQQRLSRPAWTKEVDKMIKWGALVDANDRDALIDYLSTNFSPDKPPYEPPRSAPIAKNKQ
jgi:hypothetical protein